MLSTRQHFMVPVTRRRWRGSKRLKKTGGRVGNGKKATREADGEDAAEKDSDCYGGATLRFADKSALSFCEISNFAIWVAVEF
ncbi:hypothetical protein ACFX14_034096 [Malus domestica]